LRNQNKNSDFVIPTHNRFSYWEKDISDNDAEAIDQNGQLVEHFKICLTNSFSYFETDEEDDEDSTLSNRKQEVQEEEEVTNLKKPEVKGLARKHKISLKKFKTKNFYSALQDLIENDIEIIFKVNNAEDNKKRKYKYCNFKTRCHLNKTHCKARGSLCYKCERPSHFPNSKNCLKSRQEKFRMKGFQEKLIEGCETLRHFLKAKHYHIKSGKIPFDEFQRKSSFENATKCGRTGVSFPNHLDLIKSHIEFLEQKLRVEGKVKQLYLEINCSYSYTF
jgi:hypothetical protein